MKNSTQRIERATMSQLQLIVRNEPNDVSVQLRVQQIGNGFVVKTGKSQVYYATIVEAADAIRQVLISANWNDGSK